MWKFIVTASKAQSETTSDISCLFTYSNNKRDQVKSSLLFYTVNRKETTYNKFTIVQKKKQTEIS